ncbi:hypothetical protein [Agrobacterium rubi]|uniref:hypothetical protein n=1 Tax=Agrobacterium rubi TaxID=28099 RepID=UPI0013F443D4|nr:hypothetical protein [Agrobacterium rubi]MBP1881514.1 hypothetical protein [Agrobacterium rubi]
MRESLSAARMFGLASLFHTFLMRIAREARDGGDGGDLTDAVTELMQIWDLHMAA